MSYMDILLMPFVKATPEQLHSYLSVHADTISPYCWASTSQSFLFFHLNMVRADYSSHVGAFEIKKQRESSSQSPKRSVDLRCRSS